MNNLPEMGDRDLVDELRWICASAGVVEIDPSGRAKELQEDILDRMGGPEWISVEEELPEHGDYVLVSLCYGPAERHVTLASWVYSQGWWSVHNSSGVFPEDMVSHWRELPEPPSERDE